MLFTQMRDSRASPADSPHTFCVCFTWISTSASASTSGVSCRAKLLFIPRTREVKCCNLLNRTGLLGTSLQQATVAELGAALRFTCTSTTGCTSTTASGCGTSLFVWRTMGQLLVRGRTTRHRKVVITPHQHVSTNPWMLA